MAEDDLTRGLKAAVAEAAGEAGEPAGRAEQLPLLPAAEVAALPEDAAARRQALQARRRGRPPGAVNRSTTAWRDWLLARYPSPLQALAEAYSRPVRDLADELGCKPVEAFQVQVRAAAELAPYLHGKMPVEVNVNANLPVLMLADPAAFLGGGAGAKVLDLTDLAPLGESEGNQGLGEEGEEAVGRIELDGSAKGEGDQ